MHGDKCKMLTPAAIQATLGRHDQLRPFSCFQSAVEMVLKLRGIVGEGAYPEQNTCEYDRRGYEPYASSSRHYGCWHVTFEEERFDPITPVAIRRGKELLEEGIYPIYSFEWPHGTPCRFHGFVGFRNESGDISFVTKDLVGPCPALRMERDAIVPFQKKTEILIARVFRACEKTSMRKDKPTPDIVMSS
jgi:hypothetical protein